MLPRAEANPAEQNVQRFRERWLDYDHKSLHVTTVCETVAHLRRLTSFAPPFGSPTGGRTFAAISLWGKFGGLDACGGTFSHFQPLPKFQL